VLGIGLNKNIHFSVLSEAEHTFCNNKKQLPFLNCASLLIGLPAFEQFFAYLLIGKKAHCMEHWLLLYYHHKRAKKS